MGENRYCQSLDSLSKKKGNKERNAKNRIRRKKRNSSTLEGISINLNRCVENYFL